MTQIRKILDCNVLVVKSRSSGPYLWMPGFLDKYLAAGLA